MDQPASTTGERAARAPLGVWLLAIRPRTLPAAASTVIIGTALAWYHGRASLGPALAALAIALLLQIASNLANDVYDDERGADTADRLGPTRVTSSGLLTPAQVKTGLVIVLALAFALGLYLAWVRGPLVLLIGIAAMIAAVAYTGGPYPLGYHGLGELFVFIFFGPTAVVGTYWVQTGTTNAAAWLMSVPIGLIITGVLVVNNLRDIEQDRAVGKRTIAVRIGARATRAEYVACIASAYMILIGAIVLGVVPVAAAVALLSAPLAYRTVRSVLALEGAPLNQALAATGQTGLAFSLLFAIGLALA